VEDAPAGAAAPAGSPTGASGVTIGSTL
jgi:hypothetical protein